MNNLIKELNKATNVYRTKHYIVKQVMGVKRNDDENNSIYSYDTYFKRTRSLDKEYEKLFKYRKRINGKRLPSTMYSRIYVG